MPRDSWEKQEEREEQEEAVRREGKEKELGKEQELSMEQELASQEIVESTDTVNDEDEGEAMELVNPWEENQEEQQDEEEDDDYDKKEEEQSTISLDPEAATSLKKTHRVKFKNEDAAKKVVLNAKKMELVELEMSTRTMKPLLMNAGKEQGEAETLASVEALDEAKKKKAEEEAGRESKEETATEDRKEQAEKVRVILVNHSLKLKHQSNFTGFLVLTYSLDSFLYTG